MRVLKTLSALLLAAGLAGCTAYDSYYGGYQEGYAYPSYGYDYGSYGYGYASYAYGPSVGLGFSYYNYIGHYYCCGGWNNHWHGNGWNGQHWDNDHQWSGNGGWNNPGQGNWRPPVGQPWPNNGGQHG